MTGVGNTAKDELGWEYYVSQGLGRRRRRWVRTVVLESEVDGEDDVDVDVSDGKREHLRERERENGQKRKRDESSDEEDENENENDEPESEKVDVKSSKRTASASRTTGAGVGTSTITGTGAVTGRPSIGMQKVTKSAAAATATAAAASKRMRPPMHIRMRTHFPILQQISESFNFKEYRISAYKSILTKNVGVVIRLTPTSLFTFWESRPYLPLMNTYLAVYYPLKLSLLVNASLPLELIQTAFWGVLDWFL